MLSMITQSVCLSKIWAITVYYDEHRRIPGWSCFMTMIDYYLLEARVSFCVCKNSCHVVQKLPCCLSGSSLSSDIATQVTCIVIAQCSSKFSSSDVVTCFLLSGGLVFLFVFTTPYRGFFACGRSNVRSGARTFEPVEGR